MGGGWGGDEITWLARWLEVGGRRNEGESNREGKRKEGGGEEREREDRGEERKSEDGTRGKEEEEKGRKGELHGRERVKDLLVVLSVA